EAYAELWRARGFAHCIEAIFADLSVVSRTLKERNGERRLTNLRHLVELMQEAQTTQHLGMFGLIRFIEEATSDLGSMSMAPEARQLRLESDDQAVVLTTAHKSKGLEYNIVVLPVLGKTETKRTAFSQRSYRYYDPAIGKSLLEVRTGKQDTYPLHERAEFQEGLRLAYVALTRAKHQVVTFVGAGQGYSALGYLLYSRLLGDVMDPVSFRDRQKELKDVDLRAALQRWADGHPIEIAAPSASAQADVRRTLVVKPLVAPARVERIVEQESTSSFSAMTRTQHLSQKSRQGRAQVDHDAVLGMTEQDERARALGRSILADFPRGPGPGEALHSILELSRFGTEYAEQRREVALLELRRSGIAVSHLDAVHQAIEDVLAAALPALEAGQSYCLNQVAERDKYCEMEFNLLAGSPASSRLATPGAARAERGKDDRRVSVHRLALALAGLPSHYVRAVSALKFDAFSGFLRGFMDLVYLRDGRLFVLDYKSNFLGENYADYGNKALQAAMEEHHYLLQAMLYSVALHRYAQVRIENYSYDLHFGGMHYLFLRGMHPALADHGVYRFRPSLEAIERLAGVLGQQAHLGEGRDA
ncbi:MAG TPA: 3'-5' exonuclease, partial [Polyangiaceae bacterium]|nr:3'-5' exonuclease [Polyangiaceae bacterium]